MDTFPLFDTLPAAAAAAAPASPRRPPAVGAGRTGAAPELPPAPPAPSPVLRAPEDFHPALWRAHQVGRQPQVTWPSGHAELDAELPGGGWPAGTLTELLLPHPGIGEMRLLAPVLAAVQHGQRCVMLFDPPAAPCGWVLGALGVDVRQLVLVQGRRPLGCPPGPPRSAGPGGGQDLAREWLPASHTLWAIEQALKSGHVGALLAWLPRRLPTDALRRLQLAAQAHDGPVFLLREVEARLRPSASPLRLLLGAAGPDELSLQIFKRRGPPLLQPLTLALAPVLSAPVRRRALRHGMPALPGEPAMSGDGFALGVAP